MVTIPKEKSKPVIQMDRLTWLIYGAPKIGKSTFAANFKQAIFLDTEGGLNCLEVAKVTINTWEDFLDACNKLCNEPHSYDTIVIDTVEYLYRFCEDYICRKNRIEYPGDEEWGKGWALIRDEFTRAITKLVKTQYGIVMISHGKLLELEVRGRKFNRTIPSLPNIARNIIMGLADIVLFIESKNIEGKDVRIVWTKPTESWEAGDRTNLLPEQLPFDFAVMRKYFEPAKGGK